MPPPIRMQAMGDELGEQAGAASLRSSDVVPSGIFYGWIIVWAAFVILTIFSGITYSTPVLFRFFEAEFAIGRGQAAFIFSLSQLITFVVAPVAGSLAEKHGPRLVVGGGLAVLALGLLGAARSTSYGQLLGCYGVMVGIGSGAIYVPLLGMAGAISCALTARVRAGLTGRAGMIPRADECRRKAKEAEAMAEAARDQAAREIYTEVAKQWRTLADQAEKRGW